jgi:hypothetical protein
MQCSNTHLNLLLVASLALAIWSCAPQPPSADEGIQNGESTPIEGLTDRNYDFSWLEGHWHRLGQKGEAQTYEVWRESEDGQFLGHGFVLQGTDTVWEERMVLLSVNDGWQLRVKTPGNDDEVQFAMTSSGPYQFIVKNPQHDFPQRIHYWLDNGQLMADVSADTTVLNFVFARIGE